jgi:transcriptional regulator with XRE-family HTH domain
LQFSCGQVKPIEERRDYVDECLRPAECRNSDSSTAGQQYAERTLRHGKQLGVCTRLAEVRTRHFGPRGKSRFARELGIGSSTYDRYERDRMPPADLLLKAAETTGVSLRWLITGEGLPEDSSGDDGRAAAVAQRVSKLLQRRPEMADQFESLLKTLEQRDAS